MIYQNPEGYACPKCKSSNVQMDDYPHGYPIRCLDCKHKKSKRTIRDKSSEHTWYKSPDKIKSPIPKKCEKTLSEIRLEIKVEKLEKEAKDLTEELIGTLWEVLSKGDVKNDCDDTWYGHMFSSDFTGTQRRLIELGQAEWVNKEGVSKNYYVKSRKEKS